MLTVLLILIIPGIPAFAMSKKPSPNSYEGCVQRVYPECSTNVQKFGPFNAAWYSCAARIYPVCRCTYRPELAQRAGDNCQRAGDNCQIVLA